MGSLKNIVNTLHKRTKRDYLSRMADEKIKCMEMARKYDFNYWDGDRRFGYGGYRYDGRWQVVAEMLIKEYDLKSDAKILDVGCGKGFLLYELKKLLPDAEIKGFDLSEYAIENIKKEIKNDVYVGKAENEYPYEDNYFDLVISLTTLHNLLIFDLFKALKEMERVGKNAFMVVEAYTSEEELFNLQCWALTCEQFHRPEEWEWIFQQAGYTGDYEFIYF